MSVQMFLLPQLNPDRILTKQFAYSVQVAITRDSATYTQSHASDCQFHNSAK